MITQEQIKKLSGYYQIDSATIMREYLQLVFLNSLYQLTEAGDIYFKGGTAIHLLFDSPRFSEDLDFATRLKRGQIKKIVQQTEKNLRRQMPAIEIVSLYAGKRALRYRLRYTASRFKYPFVIRLDFGVTDEIVRKKTSSLKTGFPLVIFPLIRHLGKEEILAEKIRALLVRGKGRDVFDLWYLLEQGVRIDESMVKKKLAEIERKFTKQQLYDSINRFNQKKLKHDLDKFLPRQKRQVIVSLGKRLKENLQAELPEK